MASSSQIACASPPSSDPCWKYDVFLSFRGVDTRKGITVDIHDRLNRSGIKTFMDEQDLQVGDVISPTLLAAIKESRFAIVVLSQNYASSTWCLEELREICECMKDRNRILPLFYHVEPSDVRYQKKRSFEEAFSKHETSGRHELKKVKQWRDSLYKVANFSGWNTSDYKTHKELVDVIVEFLCSKVVPDAIESTGDFEAFKATRQAMNEVIEALKDDEVTAIGVYGMGGVGKTTMVKHVGAQGRKSGIFKLVIMAIVSQSPDLEKIQGTLAELLRVELKEVTEIGRAARLSKEIMRRNQILIILDDIWERMDLSKIGIPSYKELQKCNSKVLLTTRLRNVCHVMRCQRKITLSILSKDDSWALFVRNAGRSFESTNFEDVARRVARECCGLPIALITVARALGDKDLVEHKRAAQRLEKSQTANPDDYGEASKCIKLSYDYLKDEDYKSYFLLCCLFPEDYEIEIEDLFRYAIGKGLFQDADTLEEAREKADSVATHLKHSCLLLEGERIKCVRMHDVVRDTAMQIAKSEHGGILVRAGCGLKDWPRQFEFNPNCVEFDIRIGRYKYAQMETSSGYGHKSICLKLDTISKLPDWFCKAVMNKTERLQCEGCGRLIDIFVESEHGRLHGLKYLYVVGYYRYELMNALKWVPKIPVFKNLEKLHLIGVDCQELWVGELPPGSFLNLKLLYVKFCYNWGNVVLPSMLQRLPNLEELYCLSMKRIEYVFGCEALLEPKQSKLSEIHLSHLNTVRSLCDGPAPPAMFQTLQTLSIKYCHLQGSLFTSDVAQCLLQLKCFDLQDCPFLERIVEASNKKIILPKLKELRLTDLQMLCYESATFDIECPSLKYLYVWNCPKFSASSSDFHSRKQVHLQRCVTESKTYLLCHINLERSPIAYQ